MFLQVADAAVDDGAGCVGVDGAEGHEAAVEGVDGVGGGGDEDDGVGGDGVDLCRVVMRLVKWYLFCYDFSSRKICRGNYASKACGGRYCVDLHSAPEALEPCRGPYARTSLCTQVQ